MGRREPQYADLKQIDLKGVEPHSQHLPLYNHCGVAAEKAMVE